MSFPNSARKIVRTFPSDAVPGYGELRFDVRQADKESGLVIASRWFRNGDVVVRHSITVVLKDGQGIGRHKSGGRICRGKELPYAVL